MTTFILPKAKQIKLSMTFDDDCTCSSLCTTVSCGQHDLKEKHTGYTESGFIHSCFTSGLHSLTSVYVPNGNNRIFKETLWLLNIFVSISNGHQVSDFHLYAFPPGKQSMAEIERHLLVYPNLQQWKVPEIIKYDSWQLLQPFPCLSLNVLG